MGKRIADGIAGSILLTLVIVLAIGAYARNSSWESEIELWRDCVKKSPQKERSHHNLGYSYYEEGRLEEARKEFQEALTLNPDYTLSRYNLGLVYYRKGRMKEAIDCYKKTIALDRPLLKPTITSGLPTIKGVVIRMRSKPLRHF